MFVRVARGIYICGRSRSILKVNTAKGGGPRWISQSLGSVEDQVHPDLLELRGEGLRLGGCGASDGFVSSDRNLDRCRCSECVPGPPRRPCVLTGNGQGYAFDLVNFARFLIERDIEITHVVPTTLFDWIDAQSVYRSSSEKVVSITSANGSAPASVNRRVAAVRAFFEHQVLSGTLPDNPVPSPRRGQGSVRGLMVSRPSWTGACLVRVDAWSANPNASLSLLDPADVSAVLGDLDTHRDRAIVFRDALWWPQGWRGALFAPGRC